MSGRHADRIGAAIEAYNAGEFERFLETLAEDVEWKRVDGLPDEGGTICGRDAVRELFQAGGVGPPALRAAPDCRGGRHGAGPRSVPCGGCGERIVLGVETYAVYRFNADGLAHRVENWRDRGGAERSSGLTLSGA